MVLVLVSQHSPHAQDLSPYHEIKSRTNIMYSWGANMFPQRGTSTKTGEISSAAACFAA
uniref:Uncharacterized protein n=1 Tax=Arundo donax TaxID=35708 RepID=A0A0A9HQK3_ARUDO